jgi:hypothetical protein
MNSRVTTLSDCGILTIGVLILVATDVLLENTPTVPVRASCVPLAGQAAWTAALGSGALGGGAIGRGALTCADLSGDVERGFGFAASTLTGGNTALFAGCCAGVSAGGEDGADCGEEGSCAGATGGDGDSGAACAGGDGDSGAACAGGDAWAYASFALAAASAR